jgi:hypothetical protein
MRLMHPTSQGHGRRSFGAGLTMSDRENRRLAESFVRIPFGSDEAHWGSHRSSQLIRIEPTTSYLQSKSGGIGHLEHRAHLRADQAFRLSMVGDVLQRSALSHGTDTGRASAQPDDSHSL